MGLSVRTDVATVSLRPVSFRLGPVGSDLGVGDGARPLSGRRPLQLTRSAGRVATPQARRSA